MPEDVAYIPLLPYDKELAFEYFTNMKELIAQNTTATASGTYTVPKNKILFITDLHLSMYMENFYTNGTIGKGYFHVKTNDATFPWIAMLIIKGGRNASIKGGDSSDHLSLNFPMPLRIPSGTVITFVLNKSSTISNSIVWGFCCMHGYLLKK